MVWLYVNLMCTLQVTIFSRDKISIKELIFIFRLTMTKKSSIGTFFTMCANLEDARKRESSRQVDSMSCTSIKA